MAGNKEKTEFKKKVKKSVPAGEAHVNCSFNNCHITITDQSGNVISKVSSGMLGFKGSRKATPYAASQAAKKAAEDAMRIADMKRLTIVYLVGGGMGRESAVRELGAAGLAIAVIKETTPIAHNGCRPPKKRRV